MTVTTQPTAPPTRPVAVIDISDELLMDIETAVPCQIDLVVREHAPCTKEPMFLVVFKEECDHGSALSPGDPLVCSDHAGWIVRGDYMCGACGCPLRLAGGWRHMIIKFQEI